MLVSTDWLISTKDILKTVDTDDSRSRGWEILTTLGFANYMVSVIPSYL